MAVATMTKRERVFAALRGDEVDGVPVSAWGHDFLREWSAQGLAQATLEAYRKYDWDFIKVNPRATYYAEAWGARYQPSGQADQPPQLIEAAINSPQDLGRIQPLDITQGPFAEQRAALAIIARELRGEGPFIQTVFSPLAVMSRLAGSTQLVQRLMGEAPGQLQAALAVIADTLADYARACLDAGAQGIFLATVEWGSRDNISPDDYDRFARPFDLVVLAAVRDAPFNVLHVCRDNNLLGHLLDYPVAAFHWAVPTGRQAAHGGSSAKGGSASGGNPRLAHILSRTDRAVMGGVAHDSTIVAGTPEAVAAEARAAIAETGGRRFLLAPTCAVDPRVPEGNLHALREAVQP